MIYDCFTFFGELDLLEIRLTELSHVVDKFVIVESPITFAGQKKPMVLWENQRRFKDWLDRIIYVGVPDRPEGGAWGREAFSRNCISVGLKDAKSGDTILISDLDEIPRPKAMQTWEPRFGPCRLKQSMYSFWLNCASDEPWAGTVITTKEFLDRWTPHSMRHHPREFRILKKGGWHFSYMGGEEAIRIKIEASIHQELNIPEYNNPRNIQDSLTGQDLFGRGIKYKFVPIDGNFPLAIRNNLERYKHLIHP